MRHAGGQPEAIDGEKRGLASLLWPSHYPVESRPEARLTVEAAADLDIGPVVQALSGNQTRHERFVTALLMQLCTDPAVISYRAEVIDNLIAAPEFRAHLNEVLPVISTLVRERQRPLFRHEWTPGEMAQRLGELELYVEVALQLTGALETNAVQAPALQHLRASVRDLTETAEFRALRAELPSLRSRVEDMKSVTIGVNLSPSLEPASATILSIDSRTVEGSGGMLQRLLGRDAGEQGITRLRGPSAGSAFPFFPPMLGDRHGRENELVEDLRRLLEKVMTPVGEAIERYVWAHTRDFAVLESELSFLLNGVALIERLRGAGLPMTRAVITPIDKRRSCLDGSYNVSLALRMMTESDGDCPIVSSPITFDAEHGRVWILTGPNRGGKTTYIRAAGLAHLLFQAGMYVPARNACLSPIDGVFTHFPNRETATPGAGRLDDEARRLAAIFREATPRSLILLNEVLSGTSTLEAVALAHDAVRGLRLLGARAIYVTHLHELAARADEINLTTGGDGTVGTLVAGVDDMAGDELAPHERTFRIQAGRPLGVSYASEIAEQHGISYRQLVHLLGQRGLVQPSPSLSDET